MSDEGFHEIQLNGKQLVFLFMAASVVAVVIFLCGVMVGRGVPTRPAAADTPEQADLDPTASLRDQPPSQSAAGSSNGPIAGGETLTYSQLLEDPNPPTETLAPLPELSSGRPQATTAPAQPAVKPSVATAPKPSALSPAAPAPKSAAAPPAPAPREAAVPRESSVVPSLTEPAGNGFVVQVAAVRQRAEADTIARRLSSKGYPVFVTTSGPNFRVRVGKFNDRREADQIAVKLEREERFKPWITR